MKGYYISTVSNNYQETSKSGVYKKVNAQIKAISKYFEITQNIHNTSNIKNSIVHRIKRRLPLIVVTKKWIFYDYYKTADFFYFRKELLDKSLFTLFCKIKKENPKCKVLLEIPTYPYDREIVHGFREILNLPLLLKDIYNRNKLHKYIDRIITYTEDINIFGIPTIVVKNGIDFSTIPIRNISSNTSTISVIAVASISFWHGYDRFITGMGEYYKNNGKRNIVFHIVGIGAPVSKYKKIVSNYNIERHIIFHGCKIGKDLDDIYDIAAVGIDTLGSHRKGLERSSSLKSREYAAKGLPIITSINIDIFDIDSPYIYIVPADDSNVDIADFIKFYDSLYNGSQNAVEIAEDIRKRAFEKSDINIVMQPIIDYLMDHVTK